MNRGTIGVLVKDSGLCRGFRFGERLPIWVEVLGRSFSYNRIFRIWDLLGVLIVV